MSYFNMYFKTSIHKYERNGKFNTFYLYLTSFLLTLNGTGHCQDPSYNGFPCFSYSELFMLDSYFIKHIQLYILLRKKNCLIFPFWIAVEYNFVIDRAKKMYSTEYYYLNLIIELITVNNINFVWLSVDTGIKLHK